MNFCSGRATNLVDATHIGSPEWHLRGRLHAPGDGRTTAFAGRGRRLSFNRDFWETLNVWALNLDHWTESSVPHGAGPRSLAWFGEVGTMACNRPTAAHNRARGFDLCQIRFTNGEHIDMNASHVGGLGEQRLYLAAAASLRRYFGTVLTCWYNDEHRDHLHIDDLTAVHPIRSANRTDTTLVQAAARLLNDDDVALDGIWNDRTELAYQRLVCSFGLDESDPRTSVNDGILLLTQIMRAGLAGVDAHAVGDAPALIDDGGLVGGITEGQAI